MDTVFFLQRIRSADQEDEDAKTIGVCRTDVAAKAVIDRREKRLGFRDYPDGWIISAMRLDQDNWSESFGFNESEEA